MHPLSAVQTEYSLWTRDVEVQVLPTLRELGVGLVAYSPLGRGFLTGAIRAREALAEDDSRRRWPRFADGNLEHNLELLDALEGIAGSVGAAPSQVALAWVLAQGEDVGYIADQVGHSTTKLTQDLYRHVFKSARLDAMRRLNGAIPCSNHVADRAETAGTAGNTDE